MAERLAVLMAGNEMIFLHKFEILGSEKNINLHKNCFILQIHRKGIRVRQGKKFQNLLDDLAKLSFFNK